EQRVDERHHAVGEGGDGDRPRQTQQLGKRPLGPTQRFRFGLHDVPRGENVRAKKNRGSFRSPRPALQKRRKLNQVNVLSRTTAASATELPIWRVIMYGSRFIALR